MADTSDYFSKSNTGGAIASRGFKYQDTCTLIELFQVVDNDLFRAISIETIDDFTIIMKNTEILFQVKKMKFDIQIINKVFEKNIHNKEQGFIFTSKDSKEYNGLFDKINEYRESEKSSRSDSGKELIKEEIKDIIKNKGINNSEKYLNTKILIYEESNIDDILYAKYNQWVEVQKFYIENRDNFLNELRLIISDKKSNRGELKKEEFNELIKKYSFA